MKKIPLFIVVTIAIIGFVFAYPHIFLSPGNLYQSHDNLKNDCLACHQPFSGTPNEKCISCHKVAEIGVKNNKVLFHQKLESQNCISCHSDHKGMNVKLAMTKFEHQFLPQSNRNNCISCHTKPKNELHTQVSNSCISCHSTRNWTAISNFNHNVISSQSRNNCVSCHQPPKDNFHSISNSNCISCHSLTKWKPSTFNHSKFFILDENHNSSCVTCHKTNDFKTYTCFGCHNHTINNIREEHLEEGITNFTDCIRCHKNGSYEGNEMDEKNTRDYINKESKNKEEDD